MKDKKLIAVVVACALPLLLFVVLMRQKSHLPTLIGVAQEGLNLSVTPDGRFLVQGDTGMMGQLLSYDLTHQRKNSLSPPAYTPGIGTHSMAVLADSHRIAGTGAQFEYQLQTSIAIYDLHNPKNFKIVAANQVAGPALAASPVDNTVAAFNSQGDLCFWDATTAQLMKSWKKIGDFTVNGRNKSVSIPQTLTFSPDGLLLAMAGRADFSQSAGIYKYQYYSGSIELRDVKTGAIVRNLEFPANQPANWPSSSAGWPPVISSLQFSPDGKLLATGCHGAGIAIWKVKDGQLYDIWIHPEHVVIENGRRTIRNMFGGGDLTFSPDSQFIAAASNYGQVNVWQINHGKLMRQIDATGPQTFLKNGKLLATSKDRQFVVFSVP